MVGGSDLGLVSVIVVWWSVIVVVVDWWFRSGFVVWFFICGLVCDLLVGLVIVIVPGFVA